MGVGIRHACSGRLLAIQHLSNISQVEAELVMNGVSNGDPLGDPGGAVVVDSETRMREVYRIDHGEVPSELSCHPAGSPFFRQHSRLL